MTRVFLNGIYLGFLFAYKRNKRLFLSSKKAKFLLQGDYTLL